MARALKIIVALAVLGFFAWLASNLEFEERKVRAPLSGEARTNPFFAVERFSEELGADAAWEPVFALPHADGVLMLSTWNWSLSKARRQRIERWVEAGGRLVVDRTLIGDRDEFEKWSGIEQVELGEERHDDGEDENDDLVESLQENEAFADSGMFARRCDSLVEDGTQRTLRICSVDRDHALTSNERKIDWALRDGARIHALRVAVGRGSVTVLNAAPFKRRDLFFGDHATVFVRATQLTRGDEIAIFTEQDHPSLLSLVWRFGAPALLLGLLALAFALWRSGARFGPAVAATDPARRSLAEQIRGTARFALRFGGGRALHAAAVRALRDAAVAKLPSYDRLSGAERVSAVARLTGLGEDDLSPAMNYTGSRSAPELRQAIAVLESARRSLTRRSKHGN